MVVANSVLLVTLLLFQQVPRQRTPRHQAAPGSQSGNTGAVATFTGKFKSADKKFITVEVEEGQTLRMFITRSTKFIRDGKPAKASDFQLDENVTVETSRDVLMNLLAVRVESVTAKKPGQPAVN
jgi:hypothetical protein